MNPARYPGCSVRPEHQQQYRQHSIGCICCLSNLLAAVTLPPESGCQYVSSHDLLATRSGVRSGYVLLFSGPNAGAHTSNGGWQARKLVGNLIGEIRSQSVDLESSVDFGFSQNLSLWDWDNFSDDLLGSVTMFASEAGSGPVAKVARSQVEGSAYYVIYEVN